ncbi:MAG: hypothetical protein QOF38_4541 [Pseudonocardiales bacterium]|jgi:hypothetical protein|uniref:hypothetical protein n=1 Tax=Pseudonocardia sp. Cha107L01 TaxID=3457576 RepID=UPI0028C81973|nr:hypothetical protein [Pseudonocardia sp.]MDT7659826.1 hypothetical protein [Pseudonocardiales bacterium]MDT7691116.1 hypothetical protein [Pseudonocardiales bacterium]MDT7748105.1 hypothetical protein [Pseudonocardiales bacterium]
MLMATMLARMPDLRQRVQADHVPDSTGRCRECRDDTRWPCELYWIASEAENLGSGQSHQPDGSTLPAPRSHRAG